MFTRNFDNLLMGIMTMNGASLTNTADNIDETKWQNGENIAFKKMNGQMVKNTGVQGIYHPSNNRFGILQVSNYNNSISDGNFSCVMLLGTNSAEETYNDYTINTISSNELEMNNYTSSSKVENNKVVITNEKFVVNKTSSDITINEVGISLKLGDNSTNIGAVLMFRKKLDTPVVVTANGNATITLNINVGRANEPTTSEVTVE